LSVNFKKYLDKSLYNSISVNRCGHTVYNEGMFWHHNPLNNKAHYNYFIRCIFRFRELLQYPEHKLFMMCFVNNDAFDDNIIQKISDFNNKFKEYTSNYRLLILYNVHKKEKNYHKFIHIDNIDFLELHTVSTSSGIRFNIDSDNKYLASVIKNQYNFNLVNPPHRQSE